MRPANLPIAILLTSALAQAGCSELRKTHVRTDEEILTRSPITVPANRFQADFKQSDDIVEISVAPVCRLVEEEEVERTEVYERKLDDEDPVWMTVLGVTGTLPLAGGIVMLADAPNVYENNANARTYNASGQSSAIAGGVLLTALGAAMTIPPVVQAFRAVGTTEEDRIEKRQGRVLKDEVACTAQAGGAYQVQIRAPHQTIGVASGNARGKHRIDLASALPVTFFRGGHVIDSAGLYVNNEFVGTLDLSRVATKIMGEEHKRDQAAWTAAEASACQSQNTAQACAGVQAYLQSFPQGLHEKEARDLLGRPRAATPQAVVASGPTTEEQRLLAATQAASDARAAAEEKVYEKADKETQRIITAADKDAERAGKQACQAACDTRCEKSADCRAACKKEACQ